MGCRDATPKRDSRKDRLGKLGEKMERRDFQETLELKTMKRILVLTHRFESGKVFLVVYAFLENNASYIF